MHTRPLRLTDGRTCYLSATEPRPRSLREAINWEHELVRFECSGAQRQSLRLPGSWADVPDGLLRGWVEEALQITDQ
ncbi:MAG: hypothetical protein ABJD07_07030 [Gemmatimonadaceae bacterium]